MDDQFDNDLKNRIREVFDNYEDTTADEGWLLLRERFPVEEKKRPVIWLWRAGAAAAVLLFLGIGTWVFNKQTNDNTVAVNPAKTHRQASPVKQADSVAQLASASKPTSNTPPVDTAVSTPNSIAPNNPSPKKLINNNAANIAAVIKPNNGPVFTGQTRLTGVPAVSNQPVNTPAKNNVTISTPANQQIANKKPVIASVSNGVDSDKINATKANDPQYAAVPAATTSPNTVAVVKPADAPKQPAKAKPATNSMEQMFADENKLPKKPEAKPVDDKKVKFGVYAATFFNYAKGSSNQVNAGAGFTSDIKLGSNFKLSTGVALAQNTLKYNSNTPPTESAARTVSYAAVQADNSLVPASSFPVYKNYNASLVGLDVPINIKYEFNPKRTDAFISAGVSSGTFINEAYTTSYGVPHNSLLSGNSVQTNEETMRQSFNGFYFARTLNVSVGVGTAVGKNRLIIEPFLKYPLQGMGAQQIKFGAGGVNLKFNFATGKR